MRRTSYTQIKRIAKAVEKSGGKALLVGGAVRDEIMGARSKDYDLEVYGIDGPTLENILAPFGEMNAVGRQFGVFKLGDIDISIPRRDSKIGAGHKGFRVGGDPHLPIEEAARRRDLTINSIAKDPLTGEVHDPFDGRGDIGRGVLRATDPEKFVEDPLRVLRLMQFAGRFNFRVDDETADLARGIRDKLRELPRSRITDEWNKLLLKSERPSVGLKVARDLGIFEVLHPEIHALIGVEQERDWHPEGDVFVHTCHAVDEAARITREKRMSETRRLVIILGALCHDFGKPATTEFREGRIRSYGHEEAGEAPTRSFLRSLEFGGEIEERVVPFVKDHLAPRFLWREYKNGNGVSQRSIRRLAERISPSNIGDLTMVSEEDYKGRGFRKRKFYAGPWILREAEKLNVHESKQKPILMGRHLVRYLQWEPGPHFGKVLQRVYDVQLEGEVKTLYQAFQHAKWEKSRLDYKSSWGE